MSLLSGITSFIKREVFGIEDTDTKIKADKKKNILPMVQGEAEAPVDTYKVSQDTQTAPKGDGGMGFKALEETIKNIPSENFDIRTLLKMGLLEAITGFSKEDFDKLTPEQKNNTIKLVQFVIQRFDNLKNEGEINKDASPEELIVEFAILLRDAINSGAYKDAEEFQKDIDIVAELGADFENKTAEEQSAEFRDCRLRDDIRVQKELAEADKLPEDQREAAKKLISQKQQFRSRGRFLDTATRMSSDVATRAYVIVPSEDINYAAKTLLSTRCDDVERTRVADIQTHDFTKKTIKAYKEVGDEISSKALNAFVTTNVSYKSNDAVTQYQADYKADRDKFEAALQKQNNGELLTAEEQELLSLMKQEYYTSMAQGIGQGALNNVNMTNDQKAAFLAQWDTDAKSYNDYEEVVKTVNEELESNPEYSEIKAKKEEIVREHSAKEAAKNSEKTVLKKASEQRFVPTVGKQTVIIKKEEEKQNKKAPEVKKVVTTPENTFTKDKTSAAVTKSIKENGLEAAIEEYGTDAIKTVLANPNLKHLLPQLKAKINSYTLADLKKLSNSCSDTSFQKLYNLINYNSIKKELIDYREKTNSLCYSIKTTIENANGKYELV